MLIKPIIKNIGLPASPFKNFNAIRLCKLDSSTARAKANVPMHNIVVSCNNYLLVNFLRKYEFGQQ